MYVTLGSLVGLPSTGNGWLLKSVHFGTDMATAEFEKSHSDGYIFPTWELGRKGKA